MFLHIYILLAPAMFNAVNVCTSKAAYDL